MVGGKCSEMIFFSQFQVFRSRGNCGSRETVTWGENLLYRHLLPVLSCLLLSEIKKPTVSRVLVVFTGVRRGRRGGGGGEGGEGRVH